MGVKLRKEVSLEGNPVTEYMVGGFQYFNQKIKHFPHAEGYVDVIEDTYNYVFHYTDHLGNIRLSYSDANKDNFIDGNEIVEENNYYPFGLKHTAYNTNEQQYVSDEERNEIILELLPKYEGDGSYQYKYQGQEFEEELGKNTYAYQWRDYDPAIGRFNKIDRFSEKYLGVSTYAFSANSPIQYREIAGDSIHVVLRSRGVNNSTNIQKLYWGQNNNGNYSFFDSSNGSAYQGGDQFVADLTNALNSLMSGVSVGNNLVTSLAGDLNNNVEILSSNENKAGFDGSFVKWNSSNTNGAPDNQPGNNNQRPTFISLGHELAHIKDSWSGTLDQSRWFSVPNANGGFTPIPKAEIYATHVENQLRAENNLPLRTSYAAVPNGNPAGPSILFPGTRESRFYDSNGNSNGNSINRRRQMPYKY